MPPVTGSREESPEAPVVATAAEVADFCDEEEINAAGVARIEENGIVVEAVRGRQVNISPGWNRGPQELECVPLSALGATVLDRDIILPAKVMLLG